MTPKFLALTSKRTGQPIMVNPRRLNRYFEVPAPSAQPDLAGKLGTELVFMGREIVVVNETMSQIKRLLK